MSAKGLCLVTVIANQRVALKVFGVSTPEEAARAATNLRNFVAEVGAVPDLFEAYDCAIDAHFGTKADRVALNPLSVLCLNPEAPPTSYRETFADQSYQPTGVPILTSLQVIDVTHLLERPQASL